MINNWNHHGLNMAFNNIYCQNGKPSDVDMFYITEKKFLIIGEFKNELGTFKQKQKELLETFIDNYRYGGIIIYATHNKSVENGDTEVDVSKCKVEEYYFKKEWHRPKMNITVQDVFNKFEKEKKMNIISDRKETIFKSERDGRVYYSIGLSKKKQDGSYENGYMNVHFKKDVELDNKARILIKEAWLDFYTKNKQTIPYIFINNFELMGYIEDKQEEKGEQKSIDNFEGGKDIQIDPEELPFY